MFADIAIFYLNNIMDRYEYMKQPLNIIPEEIIQKIQPQKLSTQRFYIYGNKKGDAWDTPGRENRK